MFVLSASLLPGCKSAQVAEPLVKVHGENTEASAMDFWHELTTRPVTSNDDAFHGLLLFMDGQDPADSYEGRVEVLRQRDMLPGGFDEPANLAVKRGTMAVALVKYLGIKGGLTMRLIPGADHSPRYTLRELVDKNLMPPSAPHQTFSGMDYVMIIARIEDYQRYRESKAAPVVAPAQVPAQAADVPAEAPPGTEPIDAPMQEPAAPTEPEVPAQPQNADEAEM
ncbi:MAG: hypothetical protein WD042_00340 [Phycisphaeraceae bacterium]